MTMRVKKKGLLDDADCSSHSESLSINRFSRCGRVCSYTSGILVRLESH
jgi:hypothetical protein